VEDSSASNADALKRIDKEIDDISNKIKVTIDSIDHQNVEKDSGDELQRQNIINQRKICRFYNRGHCKFANI
jgi:hypothetical protein